MKTYKYNPSIHELRVFEQSHSASRSLGFFGHDGWIAAARAILTDCRGSRIAKGFARSYGEVIKGKRFASHWEITSEEVSVWLANQPEFKVMREGVSL